MWCLLLKSPLQFHTALVHSAAQPKRPHKQESRILGVWWFVSLFLSVMRECARMFVVCVGCVLWQCVRCVCVGLLVGMFGELVCLTGCACARARVCGPTMGPVGKSARACVCVCVCVCLLVSSSACLLVCLHVRDVVPLRSMVRLCNMR